MNALILQANRKIIHETSIRIDHIRSFIAKEKVAKHYAAPLVGLAPAHTHPCTENVCGKFGTRVTANLSENLIQDNNGDYAGLVKVKLAAPGATFEGLVLKQQVHSASEYWVFMAKNSYRLQVVVPGYLPLDINFRKHGVDGIESRRTYVLTITLPQTGQVQQDDGMRYLALGAGVYANHLQDVHEYSVSDGTNTYTIEASVLTYARSCARKSDEKTSNLGKALYLYNRAAVAAFGE